MSAQAVAWLTSNQFHGGGDWLRTGKSPPGNFLPARNGAKRGDTSAGGMLLVSVPVHGRTLYY
ncbi:MAG: hypothetical protein WCI23_09800 [Chlorobiaceae bacterium]